MSNPRLERRDFIKVSAAACGGLLLTFCLPELGLGENAADKRIFAPNAFLRIGDDDAVTVVLGKSEMGEGIYTSLTMLVAEELDADWRKIHVESAPVDAVYNSPTFGMQMTGGSTSVQSEWERLRKAGAVARVMLIAAAAQKWNVDPQTCRAEQGFVIHEPSEQRVSFGTLATAASKLAPPKDVPLKDASQFKLIGRSTHLHPRRPLGRHRISVVPCTRSSSLLQPHLLQ